MVWTYAAASASTASFFGFPESAQQPPKQIVQQSVSLRTHRNEFQAYLFARYDIADDCLCMYQAARNFKDGSVRSPETDKPPPLSVCTRETCWNPPPYQATVIPLGREMRGCRRVFEDGSLVINHRQRTTSLSPIPMEP